MLFMGHNRPNITDEHIGQIRKMIADNPDWNRTKLSKELCVLWDWKSPIGQIKDLSCRDLLRALDKRGLISLPAARRTSREPGGKGADKIKCFEIDISPIFAKLSELRPLNIEIVTSKNDTDLFKSYIHQYHYLKYERSVGENIRYFVYSNSGSVLACLMFGAAAWSCIGRDDYIGWNSAQRRAGLPFLANNVRFLIPEWVRVPHLASCTLAAISRRISNDWLIKYGHILFCLETFVQRDRFRGISYKAANWRNVGVTSGLGRNSTTGESILPIKDIWLYPLCSDFRDKLRNQGSIAEAQICQANNWSRL
jgi:hypothetical protein